MKIKTLKNLFLFIFLGLFYSSCIKDIRETIADVKAINQVNVDAGFAVPLVKSNVTINDLIKKVGNNSLITADQNELLHLGYRKNMFSVTPTSFLQMKDQITNGTFNLNALQIASFNSSGSITQTIKTSLIYDVSPVEIDSMLMQVCNQVLNIKSTIPHDVTVDVLIPGITKNGVAIAYQVNLPKGAVGQNSSNNLNGYLMDFTQSSGQNFNIIDVVFKITIQKNGNIAITPSHGLEFNFGIIYNVFDIFYGFAGNQQIDILSTDTIDIPALNNTSGGEFSLVDPRIKIIMENSLGLPIEAKPLIFKALTGNGPIDIIGLPNPIQLPYPILANIGTTKSDSFELNGGNSNIGTVLNTSTKQIVYDFDIELNPIGGSGRNFITSNSEAAFIADIDIPLHGTAENFVLEQTRPFSLKLDNSENLDLLKEISLRLYLENDFPLDLGIQVYFEDSIGTVLDSLLTPYSELLRSSIVNSNGDVIQKTSSTIDITLVKEQLDRILNAKNIRIKAELNTFKENGLVKPVKLYSFYNLFVKLGVQAKIFYSVDI